MRRWLVLLVAVSATSLLFSLLRLPTPLLFGGLAGALVYALSRPNSPLKLPNQWFLAGQAVVGVIVGAAVEWESLAALGTGWLLIVVISCFSLAVSVMVGQLLVRKGASPATATFATIAGGAAGLTAMADDLGADSRVVAVLQYLRLLVVLAIMPVIVTLVFNERPRPSELTVVPTSSWQIDIPFVAISVVVGIFLGKRLRLPSSAILGPLIVAASLTAVPYFADAQVPTLIESAGYLAIGVQVGLKFTVVSVRAIGAMVPTALFTIAVTIVACAALGWSLTQLTDVSGLDAYLATTPGGVYAVLGTAAATGADVTFVAAAQVLRLLIVLASAPLVAVYLRRFDRPDDAE